MKAEGWALLKMLPPSENHDPFHDYVTIDGGLTPKGLALQNFAAEMLNEAGKRRRS